MHALSTGAWKGNGTEGRVGACAPLAADSLSSVHVGTQVGSGGSGRDMGEGADEMEPLLRLVCGRDRPEHATNAV